MAYFNNRTAESNWNTIKIKLAELIGVDTIFVFIRSDINQLWFNKTLKVLRNKSNDSFTKLNNPVLIKCGRSTLAAKKNMLLV